MVKEKKVIWPMKARAQLQELYQYISEDSLQNAEKVKKDILASTRELAVSPKLHRPDKYKKNNDGSYRAYEIHHYRISYHVGKEEITIVRVRHTRMKASGY